MKYLLILTLTILVGCKSIEKPAYVTVGTIGATANAAIGAYDDYAKTHTVEKAKDDAIRQAVKEYVMSMEVARATVTSLKSGQATDTQAQLAVNTAATALSKVIPLISEFVKVPEVTK